MFYLVLFLDTARSINCLAFGYGADKSLLQTVSYGNGGRYQFIYEASDAVEQLSGFLRTVLCPLLSDIRFLFGDNTVNLSVTSFPTYYRGDELVVSGEVLYRENVSFEVTAVKAGGGAFLYRGQIETVLGEDGEQLCLEGQLHAYQLIRQSLEQTAAAETTEEKESLRGQILEYALQFRFVTDVTSLIVSPLLSEGCECPSSCSCSPSACVTDSTDEATDGIKINPETEYGDGDGDELFDSTYNRGPVGSTKVSRSFILPPATFLGTSIATIPTSTMPTTQTTTTTTTPVATTTTPLATTTTLEDTTTTPATTTTQTTTTTTTPLATITTLEDTTTTPAATTTQTTTTTTTTTTTPATTTPPPDCGVWRNLTVCVGGTKSYFQVRCGSCRGYKRTRILSCGDNSKGRCFLTLEIGRPVCELRREVRKMGRRIGALSRCDSLSSYPQTLDRVSCRFKNGACSLKR